MHSTTDVNTRVYRGIGLSMTHLVVEAFVKQVRGAVRVHAALCIRLPGCGRFCVMFSFHKRLAQAHCVMQGIRLSGCSGAIDRIAQAEKRSEA